MPAIIDCKQEIQLITTPMIGGGHPKSFNGKMRDELLNRELFTTLEEAKILIEQWRREYNQVRPHSAKNYKPPAPEDILARTAK